MINITLNDDGPVPKFENIVTFNIQIEYTELPSDELSEMLEEQAFEKSLQESSSISIAQLPGESVVERKQRIKKLRDQTKKIGFTFPGVSEEQMTNVKSDEEIESPSIRISSVSVLGEVLISFDQPMFFPLNTSVFDYSKVLKFSFIYAKNGRLQQGSFSSTKRFRNLQMTTQEKMDYYSTIPFDASHDLEEDQYYKRSNFARSQAKTSNFDQQSQPQEDFIKWSVTSHNASALVIQLSFSNAGEISSSQSGRDRMIIDILDTSLFKSQQTLKTVDPLLFSQLQKDLPPMIEDEKIVESIEQSTDWIGKLTNHISSANFLVGIVAEGSMQELYGLVRAMQMIILPFLSDVQYPAHTYIFFQGAILFSSMDIFSGEDLFENWFEFQPTEPINQRFEEFGLYSKNFVLQSGSFLILQMGIFAWHFIRWTLYKISVSFAKNKYARKLGMYLKKSDGSSLKNATLRLFLESYFEVSQAVFLGIYAFWESENWWKFFLAPTDIICSLLTILILIGTLFFPCWFLFKVIKNPDFMQQYDWFFKGMRVEEPLYQFYFMIRRLLVSILLIFFHAYPLLQISCFILFSVVNMIYLIQTEPFLKTRDHRVEIFNEGCILICLFETFTLLDPSMVTEDRNFTGWTIIFIVTLNISINLVVVSYSTACDIIISITEYYELCIQEEKIIVTNEEAQDLKFCQDWAKEKIWLDENAIDSSQFEEQIVFEQLVDKHQYRQRAQVLDIILAHQRVSDKVRDTRNRQKIVEKVRKNAANRARQLDTINEEVSMEDEDSPRLANPIKVENVLDDKGMLAGPIAKLDINLFEKIDGQGFKPINFDFLNNPSTKVLEEEIFQKVMMTKQERWENEFTESSKKICLDTNYQVIAFVIQCLIPLKSLMQEIVVSDYQDIKMQRLQKLYMMMLQRQDFTLKFESIPINFFTSLFPRGLSAPHFFRSLFPATQEPFTGSYEIDGVQTPMHILMLPNSSSLDESFEHFFNPVEGPKINVTTWPQVLVLGIQQKASLEFSMKHLDYRLFAVIYPDAAVVLRNHLWYKFNSHQQIERLRSSEVTENTQSVQMLFYSKFQEEEEDQEDQDSY